MLVALTIRDVVLIERLQLNFGRGLAALTGETGAGKSILLDALGLALGGRADSGLVRHGADQALVTAEFSLPPDHPAHAVLAEGDIPVEDTLVVRRSVSADGRSRAFVNDQSVSVGLLRRLGEHLVEVHGQFDTQGLLDPRTHRSLLDDYAGLSTELARTAAAWRAWRQVEEERIRTAAEAEKAAADEDYLRHVVEELDGLAAKPGEESHLAERRAALMNREKIVDAFNAAFGELAGDRGAERALSSALRTLGRIADKAGEALEGAIAQVERAALETSEAVRMLQSAMRDFGGEGGLEQIEERLFALRAAARKHGVAADDLPQVRDEAGRRLSLIEDRGDLLTKLEQRAAKARAEYVTAMEQLSKGRAKVAKGLDGAVAAELEPLKLGRAKFVTQVERMAEGEWGPGGGDRVTFLVATNPGNPPGALNKIASGGELSRFTLALKVVLARVGAVPTLVFDEVDAGIGGAVAAAVGERLARLAAERQVLVVTHSPQVAAKADAHYRVEKREAKGKVVTNVVVLTPEDRTEEIARMLSGASVTEAARAAAISLIAGHPQ
ncbi:MAG TPA: DNA repair protein RecN [Alphaproteobacteria bacterium]|nr:DNA repair protein RecN [Alphaproteobacteria bacterium]